MSVMKKVTGDENLVRQYEIVLVEDAGNNFPQKVMTCFCHRCLLELPKGAATVSIKTEVKNARRGYERVNPLLHWAELLINCKCSEEPKMFPLTKKLDDDYMKRASRDKATFLRKIFVGPYVSRLRGSAIQASSLSDFASKLRSLNLE